MREEEPLGGNLNAAMRVGDTVRRRAGPWTPAVHALLRYLETAGFEAPRVQGMDEQGREVLGFIEGVAHPGNPEPLPEWVFAEEHLLGAARFLRRYHDLVARFQPPPDALWRLVSPQPHEIICHNDWSPWNALYRDGQLAVMLDWDLAGPGPRIWDIANAAYCWVPLISTAISMPDLDERPRRLRLFCDAYGLRDRRGLVAAMRARLIHVGQFIDEQARLGDLGMQKLVGWDTPRRMFEDDVGFLDRHSEALGRALD